MYLWPHIQSAIIMDIIVWTNRYNITDIMSILNDGLNPLLMLLVCWSGQSSTLTTSTRDCIDALLAQDVVVSHTLHCITHWRPNNTVIYFNLILLWNFNSLNFCSHHTSQWESSKKIFLLLQAWSFNFLSLFMDVSFKWSYCKTYLTPTGNQFHRTGPSLTHSVTQPIQELPTYNRTQGLIA